MTKEIWYLGHGDPGGPLPDAGASLEALTTHIAKELHAIRLSAARNRLRALHDGKVEKTLGLMAGYDAQEVGEAGWGVMYAPGTPQGVKDALDDLVAFRTPPGQPRREFTYEPGKTVRQFRQEDHGEDFKVVNPENLPYYFLLVGSPEDIPYEFQYDLNVAHAVGRLCFPTEDADAYRRYAERVVQAESGGGLGRERCVAHFSPDHDEVTAVSAEHLATPLAQRFEGRILKTVAGTEVTYQVVHKNGDEATHAALDALLAGEVVKPALLFTASHGRRPPAPQPAQVGALRCQSGGYFSSSDVKSGHQMGGLVFFAFACYSAGAPGTGATAAGVSHLPQSLLAQGALCFLGHVGQAWSYSFGWPGVGPLTGTFKSTVTAILAGQRVGHAFDQFNDRYLALCHELLEMQPETGKKALLDQYLEEEDVEEEIAQVWTARNDARAYVLLGDPAVRLQPELMG